MGGPALILEPSHLTYSTFQMIEGDTPVLAHFLSAGWMKPMATHQKLPVIALLVCQANEAPLRFFLTDCRGRSHWQRLWNWHASEDEPVLYVRVHWSPCWTRQHRIFCWRRKRLISWRSQRRICCRNPMQRRIFCRIHRLFSNGAKRARRRMA